MAGNVEGGRKAAAKNLAKNPNFYKEIGSIGGSKKGVKKGFALMTPEERRAAGRKGGMVKGASYKKKLDTPEQEFKLPTYQTKKKRFALWGR